MKYRRNPRGYLGDWGLRHFNRFGYLIIYGAVIRAYRWRRCHDGKSLALGDYFRQEPGAALGLIDPVFDQARCGDVVVLLAEFVS